ncbi:PREDICTED: uncharacterized protein LOC106806143 [Priapulus caudatus]|uniref:Uncharacterized protein LOC106806143 n=1 Tax=Priapulus caudatus TaxID=37621 RepID=A0ABM1DU75_PRICU|nr:PREDICTED: uncharacterized protein LOC106806143 [Priapulus caudatus]
MDTLLTTHFHTQWSKATKQWRLRPVKVKNHFSYIPLLQKMVLRKREEHAAEGGRLEEAAGLMESDPTRVLKNIATAPKPSQEELLQTWFTRYGARKQDMASEVKSYVARVNSKEPGFMAQTEESSTDDSE